ncbi:hypothetical protein [Actomonas aquatica]|uniref:Neutral/alkaline non-lysosomal ceramidase N-terminal domain-containing protein n=1 Tax=Actomonas aquatica TaxID=2866162 RepID=A0ABZ1C1L6_9BACT|nr:hypothetical protein [Opitutus sp. WL0086]WRQ85512.1 hypothetical protein K1X11_011935 [Opitutus sp. WL0086]
MTSLAQAKSPSLQAAAVTFALEPEVGVPADFTATGMKINRVESDLKSTIILIEQGDQRMALFATPFPFDSRRPLQNAAKAILSDALDLTPAEIVLASSHDHSVPAMHIAPGPDGDPTGEANDIGQAMIDGLRRSASGLRAKLVPVTVAWGVAEEHRMTYNRRGQREDGSTYFMREEDRALLGEDFVGQIDPLAPVVLLRGKDGAAVAALALFTGHPVTAYNPEDPMAFGQWPQLATTALSEHLGGAPVAFLQGCAGDINSKFMLTGTMEQAHQMAAYLSETFIKAADAARPATDSDFVWKRATATVPLAPLPTIESLQASLAEIDAFVVRAEAGDEDTLSCVGLNFPRALSPIYRSKLVAPVRRWYAWALEQRQAGTADELPREVEMGIVAAQLGGVGIVGLPFEAFVRTGFKIRQEAPQALVLTAAYVEGAQGYIPDATAVGDLEYQAGFYRYLHGRPPYAEPGADAAADDAVAALRSLHR